MASERIEELVALGFQRLQGGDARGAAQAFQEVLRLDSTHETAREQLAALALALGQAAAGPGPSAAPPAKTPAPRDNPFLPPPRTAVEPLWLTPSPFVGLPGSSVRGPTPAPASAQPSPPVEAEAKKPPRAKAPATRAPRAPTRSRLVSPEPPAEPPPQTTGLFGAVAPPAPSEASPASTLPFGTRAVQSPPAPASARPAASGLANPSILSDLAARSGPQQALAAPKKPARSRKGPSKSAARSQAPATSRAKARRDEPSPEAVALPSAEPRGGEPAAGASRAPAPPSDGRGDGAAPPPAPAPAPAEHAVAKCSPRQPKAPASARAAPAAPAAAADPGDGVEVDVDVELGDEAAGAGASAVAPSAPPASGKEPREAQAEAGESVGALLLKAMDLLDLDDHTGALALLEKALALEPGNKTAQELIGRCQSTLLTMLESKLGDLSYCPRLKMRPEEIVWLNLDHREGFLLSQIDGTVSYDDLFALSSMTRLETARILARLLQENIIA